MSPFKLLLLIILTALFSFSIFAQDISKEVEAIKEIIQSAYVDGLQNDGDMEKIDEGFHQDFNLLGIGKNNRMWKYSISNWKGDVAKKVKTGEMPLKGKNRVTIKFLNIDVTGTAAVAKIECYIGQKLIYVDYISLYKFGENWKIVSKIFFKFPKSN